MAISVLVFTTEYTIWNRRNAKRAAMPLEEKREQDENDVTGDKHHSFVYSL